MTVLDHVCVPRMDPRFENTCRKCGHELPSGLKRDRKFEADVIRNAAEGLAADPDPLIVFAQRRADQGALVYGRDFPDIERDFPQEILDEVADSAIYIAWYLDAIRRDLLEGGDRVTHLKSALRHTVLLFNEICQAR